MSFSKGQFLEIELKIFAHYNTKCPPMFHCVGHQKRVQKQIFFAIGKRHLTFSKNGMQHLVLSYNSSKRFTISSIKGPKKLKFEKFSLPLQTVVQQEPKTYYWIAKLFWLLLKKNFDKLSPGRLKRTENRCPKHCLNMIGGKLSIYQKVNHVKSPEFFVF